MKRRNEDSEKTIKKKVYGETYSNVNESIRNDLNSIYVKNLIRPQDQIINPFRINRFDEYPKQKYLLKLKDDQVNQHSYKPVYLPYNLINSIPSSENSLSSLFDVIKFGTKFDVICIDPPIKNSRSAQIEGCEWTWEALATLPVKQLSADPSFVFMWVGDGGSQGLEKGRQLLARWGFRRAEDIIWVQTSNENEDDNSDNNNDCLFKRTKQHCLMGIKGTVRRSVDSHFVHCNIDVDTIISESSNKKPSELMSLIETFCLGTRRLALFGEPQQARRGWLTVGSTGYEDPSFKLPHDVELFDMIEWGRRFPNNVPNLIPLTEEIDTLRPKSPNKNNNNNSNGTSRKSTPNSLPRIPNLSIHSPPQPPPPNPLNSNTINNTSYNLPYNPVLNAQINAQMQYQIKMQMQAQMQFQIQMQIQQAQMQMFGNNHHHLPYQQPYYPLSNTPISLGFNDNNQNYRNMYHQNHQYQHHSNSNNHNRSNTNNNSNNNSSNRRKQM